MAYRKNVKAMSIILIVIMAIIFGALFIPPYLFPTRTTFQSSVSSPSPEGFTLNLTLNTTSIAPDGEVNITTWAVSTDRMINNVTALDDWGLNQSMLWVSKCDEPVGVGLMLGYYTLDNYTQGALLPIGTNSGNCPGSPPKYFAFEYNTSTALVAENNMPYFWSIRASINYGGSGTGSNGLTTPPSEGLSQGVYTVVAADEWGDVVLANFRVT